MKKTVSIFLTLIIFVLSAVPVSCVTAFASDDNVVIHDEDALHTESYKFVNTKGEEVFLKGINLGGWLITEDWFCPAYTNDVGDSYIYGVLEERFGLEKAYELINIYQDNWIVESDFKNIADMGFNCVRIPFWYRNFQSDDNGTWILTDDGSIDFSRLEWAVDMCRKYGLYAILDLHGANGCQNNCDHCGKSDSMHLYDNDEKGQWYREQLALLWSELAKRFKDDPAVAMFDILNEPMSEFYGVKVHSKYWEVYDMAYDAIRKIDPDRVVSVTGTWSVDKLPNPKEYGWDNIVYQFHQYDKSNSNYTSRIANAWACYYNVPLFAGEFHPVDEAATLDYAINAYNSNDVSWSLWTYKGYNSWAAWSDWFAYGSTSAKYTADVENDSFEDIAYKWGAVMQTDSGAFKEAGLFSVAKKYLPAAKVDSAPFNTDADVASYVAGELYKGEYTNKNSCPLCQLFMKYSDIPLIGKIIVWLHGIVHAYSTSKNVV